MHATEFGNAHSASDGHVNRNHTQTALSFTVSSFATSNFQLQLSGH